MRLKGNWNEWYFHTIIYLKTNSSVGHLFQCYFMSLRSINSETFSIFIPCMPASVWCGVPTEISDYVQRTNHNDTLMLNEIRNQKVQFLILSLRFRILKVKTNMWDRWKWILSNFKVLVLWTVFAYLAHFWFSLFWFSIRIAECGAKYVP